MDRFRELGVALWVISPDKAEDLEKMRASMGLEFPLLRDPDLNTIRSYGILNQESGKIPHPTTVVVDVDGVARYVRVDRDYKRRPALEEVFAAIGNLARAGAPGTLIVLNKAELLQANEYDNNTPLGHLEDYRKLGYEVLQTSCKTAPGISLLNSVLKNRTSILVGQSGVGKSSLANKLLPDLDLQTGALSRVTGKGIHTTTTTIMYSMPAGGRLIDSPGVWEYGLWRMEQQELANGFIEFQSFLGGCKFNDCRHDQEPQCAISEAAESGALFPWRYQAYLRLLHQST